jgi:hypothetical protein
VHLHAKADAQERRLILAAVLGSCNHALHATQAKSSWNDDTVRLLHRLPCTPVLDLILGAHLYE